MKDQETKMNDEKQKALLKQQ